MTLAAFLLLGGGAFLTTNIDDLVLLTALYAERRLRGGAILAGQTLGIAGITLIAAAAAGLALQLSDRAASGLGVVPLALGLAGLLRRKAEAPGAPAAQGRIWRQILAVAGLTLSGGGDNLAVYIPLFAARPGEMPGFGALFLVLTLVWCGLGRVLGQSRTLARLQAGRPGGGGRRLLPLVLIAIGIFVLSGLV